MSRSFDGLAGSITATGTLLDNLAVWGWTAWMQARTDGQGGAGRIAIKGVDRKAFFVTGGGSLSATISTNGTARSASSVAGVVLPFSTWRFVAFTYATGDGGPRLWVGSLETPVSEVSYTARSDGTGANTSESATVFRMGNRNTGDRTFDGLLEQVTVWVPTSGVTAAKLEQLRTCTFPPALETELGWSCRGAWRLAESETAPDLSANGYTGTITSATAAVGVPLGVMRERGIRGLARGLAVAR